MAGGFYQGPRPEGTVTAEIRALLKYARTDSDLLKAFRSIYRAYAMNAELSDEATLDLVAELGKVAQAKEDLA